jgi:hypothetical protein
MNDKQIALEIQEFIDNSSVIKADNSQQIATIIFLYIKRQSKEKRLKYESFFIRELECNKYDFRDLSAKILLKINDIGVIPQIFSIFHKLYLQEYHSLCSFNPSTEIFLLLMKLKDKDIIHIESYFSYMESVIKSKISHTYYFSCIVQYISINKEHAIDILSDYYCQILSLCPMVIEWNNSEVFIPVHFFYENAFYGLHELIQTTYRKSKQAGVCLEKLFRDYVINSCCDNKEDWLNKQNLIRHLDIIHLSISK